MSTTFTLLSNPGEENVIALRFWAGDFNGRCTIRFAFPRVLIDHLMDAKVIGDNGETTTIGELFINTITVDFLEDDVTPRDHLGWGSRNARRHKGWQTKNIHSCR